MKTLMKLALVGLVVLCSGVLMESQAQNVTVTNNTCKPMEIMAYYYQRGHNNPCLATVASGVFLIPGATGTVAAPSVNVRLVYVEATEQTGSSTSEWYLPADACATNFPGPFTTFPTNCGPFFGYELTSAITTWTWNIPMQINPI